LLTERRGRNALSLRSQQRNDPGAFWLRRLVVVAAAGAPHGALPLSTRAVLSVVNGMLTPMDNPEDSRLKIRIELVPQPLWGKSLKKTLPRAKWDALRTWALKRAGYACEICSARPPDGKGLICHEVWEYDDIHNVQSLAQVEVHCQDCDRVTHFGRTTKLGQPALVAAALARLGEFNGWSRDQVRAYTHEAREQWQARSVRQWIQDTSWYDRWLAGRVQDSLYDSR
jgi:hypothetical protein